VKEKQRASEGERTNRKRNRTPSKPIQTRQVIETNWIECVQIKHTHMDMDARREKERERERAMKG
jgi:hypothetical protein